MAVLQVRAKEQRNVETMGNKIKDETIKYYIKIKYVFSLTQLSLYFIISNVGYHEVCPDSKDTPRVDR